MYILTIPLYHKNLRLRYELIYGKHDVHGKPRMGQVIQVVVVALGLRNVAWENIRSNLLCRVL